ncbi:MAG: hypothetical protein MUC71_09520 [Steroidobacteraceae bacterium]|jgi:hypothetical protein|nr:hypothetical protein [Steroidobacteraceae bacterium]
MTLARGFVPFAAVMVFAWVPVAAHAEDPARQAESPAAEPPEEAKPGGCKACAWLRENPPEEDSAGRRSVDGPAAPAAQGQPSNRGDVVGKGGVARATPGAGTPEPTEPAAIEKVELAVEVIERDSRSLRQSQ